MGLLSDPEYGSVKWVKLLKKVHGPVCFLCYIGAIVWFFMLGSREFNNETYFSENALLPGLVTNEFNGEYAAKHFFNEFLQELEDKYSETDEMPVPWLVAKMSQLHLEVYTHNFTLKYPMGEGQVYTGVNVYGILRAPRTSSLEALVLTAPYRPLSSHQKGTAAGIALMLAFAQFARPQKYWAKDIIFLITEHEQLGMQAWLEAYHGLHKDSETFYTSLGSFWQPGTPGVDFGKMLPGFEWIGEHQKCLDPGKLKGRSGSIQAAINLEFHTPKIKYIEVKVEGLNGQLPNLDLVNLVHKLCVKSGIHHSYKESYSWRSSRSKMADWQRGVWTMLGMASTQIAGVPNGNHGLFHRFGIEAVTLEGRDSSDSLAPGVAGIAPASFHRLGVALESIMRSLNNLLESFHQSYFFYMLAATNRFISIGQYMPSLCLLCVAMLIRALSLWVSIQDADKETITQTDKEVEETDKETVSKEDSESKIKKKQKISEIDDLKVSGEQKLEENKKEKMNIVNISANYLLVHILGYAVMNSPVIFSHLGAKYYNQPSEVSVFYGMIALSLSLIITAPLMLRLLCKRVSRDEVTLINILLLVEMATLCLTVGMHNFPLGLAVAVLYTPLALVTGAVEGNGSIWLYVRRALCLLSQPLCATWVCMFAYSHFLFPEEGVATLAGRGADAAMQALMFSVVDSMIYGNWLFNVATCLLLPAWVLFWQILCTRVDIEK